LAIRDAQRPSFASEELNVPQTADAFATPPPEQNGEIRQLIHDKIVRWLRNEASFEIDRIDYDASLFELGVDSLGAATIAGELEQALDKTLNPEVLYELETINELADYLEGLRSGPVRQAAAPAVASRDPIALDSPTGHLPDQSEPNGALQHFERLNRRVRSLKERGLYFFEPEISRHDGAWVVAEGKRMLMFGSYEYLGLLGHPQLKSAAFAAIEEFGTGHHGVRLLAGTTTIHRKLEAKLAAFMQAEDAVVFSSGYVTNLTAISTLVGRGDCVIGDQWNHASIVDGCRISQADFLEFKHNDMDSLAQQLQKTDGRRTLVVVDAVFSMDGDIADMPAVVDLCGKRSAMLMVDEAHSLGVLGKTGRGIQEHFGLHPDDIDIKMGTLSKALAGCGGFVAGRESIITYLRHHARGYIFSGALPAGQASTAIAALRILENQPELVERLRENAARFLSGLASLGFDTGKSVTPIVPVMTRNDKTTLEMTRICRDEGLLVIPVCFPAVPADAPRLRACVSAIHTKDEIGFALDTLARAGRQTNLIP
jgi:glycine C-acetyltransferase